MNIHYVQKMLGRHIEKFKGQMRHVKLATEI